MGVSWFQDINYLGSFMNWGHMTRVMSAFIILEQLSPFPALYPKVKEKTHLPNFPGNNLLVLHLLLFLLFSIKCILMFRSISILYTHNAIITTSTEWNQRANCTIRGNSLLEWLKLSKQKFLKWQYQLLWRMQTNWNIQKLLLGTQK